MRQLFIPEIGTEFTLAQDWTFDIIAERRNDKLYKPLGYETTSRRVNGDWKTLLVNAAEEVEVETLTHTLPQGTQLKVDRIYIRKGVSAFSSITFYMKRPGDKKKTRFFAKLADVNRIMMAE